MKAFPIVVDPQRTQKNLPTIGTEFNPEPLAPIKEGGP